MNRIYVKGVLVALLLGASWAGYSQIITTVAGNGVASYSGDGGQATAAELNAPTGIALDGSKNIYIADQINNRIRKINTSGIISTIAGISTFGYSGDNGPATDAELSGPTGVALDTLGNVYIADNTNNRIRKVNTSGVITTIAGNGIANYYGDGGQATAAELNTSFGVALDVSGNIYIADVNNNRIRKVNTLGIIATVAGGGSLLGDGGQATDAELLYPSAIAMDAVGNIYIADSQNQRIRKVNKFGIISTFAGNGIASYSGDGGQATSAELKYPDGLALDTIGNLYITDWANYRIRKVSTSGIISTLSGNDSAGFFGDGGQATAAELNYPISVELDAAGNIYIGDQHNNRIRKITSNSTGINKLSSTTSEINIYPSPTTGSFTITGIAQGQIIEVYNYLGQKVTPTFPADIAGHINSCQMNISSLSNGIYLIRIQNKNGSIVVTKKIVKTSL